MAKCCPLCTVWTGPSRAAPVLSLLVALPGQPHRTGPAQGDAAPKQFCGLPCSRISSSRAVTPSRAPGKAKCSHHHRVLSRAPPAALIPLELHPLLTPVCLSFATFLPAQPSSPKPHRVQRPSGSNSSTPDPSHAKPSSSPCPPSPPHLGASCLALDPSQGPSLHFLLFQVCPSRHP